MMEAVKGLRNRLWTGPLADPQAPALAIAQALPDTGYGPVQQALRLLSAAGLPVEPALSEASARWPWSIDLAQVAVEATGADDSALALLRERCAAQNRRRAAAAWAYWRVGRAHEARAVLASIDPGSETAGADLAARGELALLDGDAPAAQATLAMLAPWPEHHQRLVLQDLHLRDGTAALAQYLDTHALAHTRHWRLAFDLLLQGRDFARTRALLDTARNHHGDAPTRPAAIQLALAAERPEAARALLEPGLPPSPGDWSARDHEFWLRTALGCARLSDTPQEDHRRARDHAQAALRVFARSTPLRDLWLTCRALSDDWEMLEHDLLATNQPAVATLNRLGLHSAAQTQLEAELSAIKGANPRARRFLALADTLLLQGRIEAAEARLDAAGALAPPAPTRADIALQRAEIALWRLQPKAAGKALAPLQDQWPQRMGLWMALSRMAFLRGDFTQADAALARFRVLKAEQSGAPAPTDLRDRIIADAAEASATLPPGLMTQPVDAVVAQAGVGRIARSPGLSACLLARARPAFAPHAGPAIPARMAFYWEGPPSSAVARSISAWQRLHPALEITLYDPALAADWLARHHPDLVALFNRQALPATRADLFRIALMVSEGGLYADVDEYPRAAIDEWLEDAQTVLCQECGYGTVANNFLAARPGLPLFKRLLERVQAQLAETEAPYPWWDSGPAPLTATVIELLYGSDPMPGLRLLDQAEYCQRISTNLAFPHKRSLLHWR
ncbi:MAG: hypothetical protein JJU15_05430 [Pararhodobacter sp.]|nr:hypothetical protein [Pararhodobacter sp.]